VRTFVPEGLSESNPARSAGLAFLKSIRPGLSAIVRTTTEERDDRQMLAIAEPRAKPKAECLYRPYGTDLPFPSFPSTSYWATFKCPSGSSPKCFLAFVDAHGRLPDAPYRYGNSPSYPSDCRSSAAASTLEGRLSKALKTRRGRLWPFSSLWSSSTELRLASSQAAGNPGERDTI
jgi:hypothetical protein